MMEGKDKTNPQQPEVWELLLSIGDKEMKYIKFVPSVAGSLVMGEFPLGDDTLRSLEDAVYDKPELLEEHRRVRVIVHSRHFVLLPQETADDDCRMLAQQAFPGDGGDAAVCTLPLNGVKIAWLMPRGLQAFLGRTFNYPEVYHRLTPLCEYFKGLNGGDSLSRMFLHLQEGDMDLVIYRDGKLQCANSYPFDDGQDAAYYVLNAWRTHGLDQLTDELQLIGDASMLSTMTPVLREYVKYVMPAVYPAAAMRLGRDAMQAPLELILQALCE